MTNEYINYLYNYDAQASGLLGNFDSQNNYRIQDEIKEELLKANKLITDFKEDLITCFASIGAYKFDFRVLIQEGEGHKKRAGLFLIEKASQGFYENEIQTLIHYIVLPNDGVFVDTVKKTFNLFTRDESEGVDMANEMLQAILRRKKELQAMQHNSISVLYDLDSEYVRKMLAILKGYGLIGDRLIVDFKNIIKARNLSKIDKAYWKDLKTIMDKLIMSNLTVFDSVVLAQIQALQNQYLSVFKEAKIPKVIESVTPSKTAKKSAAKPLKVEQYGGKIDGSFSKVVFSRGNRTADESNKAKSAIEGQKGEISKEKPEVKREERKVTTKTPYKGTGHTGYGMGGPEDLRTGGAMNSASKLESEIVKEM